MKLTKYSHACVVLEENGSKLVIDPGEYTLLPGSLEDVVAVVVTHHHADHVSDKNLAQILAKNPDAVLYAHQEVLDYISVDIKQVAVSGDANFEEGPFKFKLSEHDHAVIYMTSPCRNLSVTVNDYFYYPGDSYKLPETDVEVIGVPMSGPWAKTADSIDFALNSNAKVYFPTHNAHLNEEIGNAGYNNWLERQLEPTEKRWVYLLPGDSL